MIESYGFLSDDVHILPIMEWAYLSITHEFCVIYTKKYTIFSILDKFSKFR